MAGRSPSIAIAQAFEDEGCSEGGELSSVAWTFRAWIDATGDAEQRCAALFGPPGMASDAGEAHNGDAGLETLDCAPLPSDPQVTVTRTLGEGRYRIHLEIEDR
jgi:hypothetical protein